ncbi:MarR family transcriptional regulator [Amycolatopsis carbonis]|uniref:MarR family transcriptional regulator n=1 Tax=Amycolatopsis carbonis TaxID=715471 RepID=A0A9Y2IE72_9PSEU|nr:MarR family transcriptional regulator [Amycolatopsis sp. 2-15]WIX77490.1 MarR family transcriptional regulator [Amycolatopsis sp. 2-15]
MDTGPDHDVEDGERPLGDAPLYLLRQALRTYTARWQDTVRELTPPQYVALRVLRASPDLDQAALAEATRIDTATLTPLLARLEERGHVVRRVDPGNRRRKLLRITEDGAAVLRRVAPLVAETEDTLLGELSAQQRTAFTDVLRRIAHA